MSISQLHRLVTAYAPKQLQGKLHAVWEFDARMADILRTTSEAMIGEMRLTWWDEALREGTGEGEPLIEALRRDVISGAGAEGLLSAIDGWGELLEPFPLSNSRLIAFAEHRGGGLFRQIGRLAGNCPPWLAQAGMGWALWDLSGHVSDEDTAARAVALSREFLADVPAKGWPRPLASLRILAGLARWDVSGGCHAPASLDPRQYLRLLWLGLKGG